MINFAEMADLDEDTQEQTQKENSSPVVFVENDSLNLPVTKMKFENLRKEIAKVQQEANSMKLNSDNDIKKAVTLTGEVKRISKAIESKRKDIVQAPNDYLKSVNGFCKLLTEPLNQIEAELKGKISQYQAKVVLERRKQEEIARQSALKLQQELDRQAEEANRKAREEAIRKAEEEAKAKNLAEFEAKILREKAEAEAKANQIIAPEVPAPVLPNVEKAIHTEEGMTASFRKEWKFKIINPDVVPRQFCCPDDKKIRESIKMGVRTIEGVEIYEATITVMR